MKANPTNLSILITAGLVSLGVAWFGATSADDAIATFATWSGGIGLVLSLILASTLRDDASKQHIIRIGRDADLSEELSLYARHNGYKQWKMNGNHGLIRRTSKDQPELVSFEFINPKSAQVASSFTEQPQKAPTQSNNGFSY